MALFMKKPGATQHKPAPLTGLRPSGAANGQASQSQASLSPAQPITNGHAAQSTTSLSAKESWKAITKLISELIEVQQELTRHETELANIQKLQALEENLAPYTRTGFMLRTTALETHRKTAFARVSTLSESIAAKFVLASDGLDPTSLQDILDRLAKVESAPRAASSSSGQEATQEPASNANEDDGGWGEEISDARTVPVKAPPTPDSAARSTSTSSSAEIYQLRAQVETLTKELSNAREFHSNQLMNLESRMNERFSKLESGNAVSQQNGMKHSQNRQGGRTPGGLKAPPPPQQPDSWGPPDDLPNDYGSQTPMPHSAQSPMHHHHSAFNGGYSPAPPTLGNATPGPATMNGFTAGATPGVKNKVITSDWLYPKLTELGRLIEKNKKKHNTEIAGLGESFDKMQKRLGITVMNIKGRSKSGSKSAVSLGASASIAPSVTEEPLDTQQSTQNGETQVNGEIDETLPANKKRKRTDSIGSDAMGGEVGRINTLFDQVENLTEVIEDLKKQQGERDDTGIDLINRNTAVRGLIRQLDARVEELETDFDQAKASGSFKMPTTAAASDVTADIEPIADVTAKGTKPDEGMEVDPAVPVPYAEGEEPQDAQVAPNPIVLSHSEPPTKLRGISSAALEEVRFNLEDDIRDKTLELRHAIDDLKRDKTLANRIKTLERQITDLEEKSNRNNGSQVSAEEFEAVKGAMTVVRNKWLMHQAQITSLLETNDGKLTSTLSTVNIKLGALDQRLGAMDNQLAGHDHKLQVIEMRVDNILPGLNQMTRYFQATFQEQEDMGM